MANTSPPVAGMPVHDRPQITPPVLQSPVVHNMVRTAIPMVVQQGTVASTGIVTLNQAMPATYANAWLWLPAGAIVGGAAGWYFVKFTSTTQGQVYQVYMDPASTQFWPYLPAIELFPAVGSGSAYTIPTATDFRFASMLIPGNSMGANGALQLESELSALNNANAKTLRLHFGGTLFSTTTLLVSQAGSRAAISVANRGTPNSQRVSASGFGAGQNGVQAAGVDTTASQALWWAVQLATATDYVVMETFVLNEAASS